MSYDDARREYESREPAEVRAIPVRSSMTLGDLERLLDDCRVTRVTVRLAGRMLTACVETRDADGDGAVLASRPGALADAIGDALSAAVAAQREIDAAVGS